MSFSFFLQKSWNATSPRPNTITSNATTNVYLPYGREVVTVSGKGQPGNYSYSNPGSQYSTPGNSVPGNAVPGNAIPGNAIPGNQYSSPGNVSGSFYYSSYFDPCAIMPAPQYYPGCGTPFSASGFIGGCPVAGSGACTTYYNPTTFGYNPTNYNPTNYNPTTYNPTTYNPTTFGYYSPTPVPGNASSPFTVMGVSFPGAPADTTGATVSPTVISYYSYPDNTTQPVPVPSGAQVVVKIE